MMPCIAFVVAVGVVLTTLAGFAHEPTAHADLASDGYSGTSSGDRAHVGAQLQRQDDDGPDVLLMALLTVGAGGAAAIVALIGYVVRQRVGFWLHRPPARDSSQPEDHH